MFVVVKHSSHVVKRQASWAAWTAHISAATQARASVPGLLAHLKECGLARDLERARLLHAAAAAIPAGSSTRLLNALVDVYGKCGSLLDARRVFESIHRPDVVSWTSLIMGYADNGEGETALDVFEQMRSRGCAPNAVTFVAALKACACLAAKERAQQQNSGTLANTDWCLEKAKDIHRQASEAGCDHDSYVANTLIDAYAKSGSMVDARKAFDWISRPGTVSWNALIFGYVDNGQEDLAIDLFQNMLGMGCSPTVLTFVACLKACSSLAENGKLEQARVLEKGIEVHRLAATKFSFESHLNLANTVLHMYSKCHNMLHARNVFNGISRPSVVSWTALLSGYAENGEEEQALELFALMQLVGCTPNAVTFVAALKACIGLAAGKAGMNLSVNRGMAVHSEAFLLGCDVHAHAVSTLISMYAKSGRMLHARRVFGSAQTDAVSWTALILGYAENGQGEIALEMFDQMNARGISPHALTFVAALKACANVAVKEVGREVDGREVKQESLKRGMDIHCESRRCGHDSHKYVANTLVSMYAKCGCMVEGRKVFDGMRRWDDVVSWTALILGYAENGEAGLAIDLFDQMRSQGCQPDSGAFAAALKACGALVALPAGRRIHAEIRACSLETDIVVATSLIDFYGKCGSMKDSKEVFDSLARKDSVAWTALLAGYSRLGDTDRVLGLFRGMQSNGLQADGVTFLCILTACSHAGLVELGKEYFEAMKSPRYSILPGLEHYHCMVDMLGRCNRIQEAVTMVESMPFQANAMTWRTLLGACRKWGNVETGERAFAALVELDGSDTTAYALMGSIYGALRMWEQQAKVEARRVSGRAWRRPGQSWWTDNAGKVHSFVVGDKSHSQSETIHAKLKQMTLQLKEQQCYVPFVGAVVHNVSEEEKEDMLCGHSEKLAIACALINTEAGTTIRIAKNLRVCEDCHAATAAISKMEQRIIICRDASRFHVFEHGKCSCEGFW